MKTKVVSNPKVCLFIIFLSLFTYCNIVAQTKTPAIFRWQDKHSKKYAAKFLLHDTLIKTEKAVIHITYNKNPTKPYVLLLHGMGSNGRTTWRKQIKVLSKKYNVILPDLIYFGESTSTSNDFSVEFQAEQIHQAINKIGITDKINVIGYSYGGLTAAIYNQLYNETVDKLVIIDGPVKYYTTEQSDSLAIAAGAKSIIDVIVPANLTDYNAFEKAVASHLFHVTKGMKRKIIATYFTPYKTIRTQQMNYLVEHHQQYQSYNYNLDKTKVLLVWGEKDGVVPVTVGKKLHQTFPDTKLIIYPNIKHDVPFSETKNLNKELIDFIGNK